MDQCSVCGKELGYYEKKYAVCVSCAKTDKGKEIIADATISAVTAKNSNFSQGFSAAALWMAWLCLVFGFIAALFFVGEANGACPSWRNSCSALERALKAQYFASAWVSAVSGFLGLVLLGVLSEIGSHLAAIREHLSSRQDS